MDSSNLKAINDSIADKNLADRRHKELVIANSNTANSVLSATESLVKYLNGHISKVELTNQLSSIRTPDTFKVVDAVNSLHDTLKTHENTDLTELTKLMSEMLSETKMIPKDHMTMPEMKMVDYTDQLKSLKDAIIAVEEVVKSQKLVAEAPIVNVDAPIINVEKQDLTPLQTAIKDVVSAVNSIVIPEYKTDNKAVEKLVTISNKLLKGILDKPVSSGGGGGGGRATPYQDSNSIPAFVTLTDDGKIPIDIDMATEGIATSAKQDSQIILETTANTLLETVQELCRNMASIASAKGISADLRVTPLTTPNMSTLTTLTGQTNIGGLSAIPMVQAAINNLAIQSNINNVIG